MELKLGREPKLKFLKRGSNRTFMELKLIKYLIVN